MSADVSGREYKRTPWEVIYNKTPLVEGMDEQLFAAFGTMLQRLQTVVFGGEASPIKKRAAAQSIWGLQQADRLLALRQGYKEKEAPPHEINRFKNLNLKQLAIIHRMQRKLLSAARALMAEHEVTNPPSVDGPPDASAHL